MKYLIAVFSLLVGLVVFSLNGIGSIKHTIYHIDTYDIYGSSDGITLDK